MTSSEHDHPSPNLEEMRQQRQEVVEHVLDLLEKAEERSAEEPENETKWRKILNHLWKSLDEAKARLGETEAALDLEKRKAAARSQSAPPAEQHSSPIAASLRELDAFANTVKPAAGALPGRTFQERRRQILFRCAIDKVKDRRIAGMTIEELDLAIEFFQTLHSRQDENKENEKLAQFLAKTNIHLEEVCAEMRRHRAQLYAKKAR